MGMKYQAHLSQEHCPCPSLTTAKTLFPLRFMQLKVLETECSLYNLELCFYSTLVQLTKIIENPCE